MKKILIIEDDSSIARFLNIALKTNHYEVILAENGIHGINSFLSHNPDLVILDLGLPDIDGSEVLSQIRQMSPVPILIVSARDKEKEKVEALDQGADDYVTKPFNIEELLARIRVAFRKTSKQILKEDTFIFGSLKIDFSSYKIFVDDQEIHLTPLEFKLLKLLIDHQGKVLTHKFIQQEVWGYDASDDYQSQRVFMAAIRRKIEKNTSMPVYILTEIGIGYRFVDSIVE